MSHARLLASLLVLSALGVTTLTAASASGESSRSGPAAAPSGATTSSASSAFGDFAVLWRLASTQTVIPGPVLIAKSTRHHSSRGTRSDNEFFEISSTGSNDVPEAALRAYHHAEKAMAQDDPGCHISWTLLAAIGRVESNHGRFGGAQLGSDGVSRPEIRGPQLNGAGAFAAIADSDDGRLDRDQVWDRAVGQMQFLPQTWASVARDGDGDGRKNPDDIDDSALGSAVYLCGVGGSLADPAGMSRAAFRYNHSDYYVQLVLSFQAGYATGVFAVPSPPPPAHEEEDDTKDVRGTTKGTHKNKADTSSAGTSKPRPETSKPSTPRPVAPKPTPKPTPEPSPTPTPAPTPTAEAPQLEHVDGIWQACGPRFCLNGNGLDLGQPGSWNDRVADFDGDGSVEPSNAEFNGLVGQHVSLQVERSGGDLVVYVIGGKGLRNADGSSARMQLNASAEASTPSPTS